MKSRLFSPKRRDALKRLLEKDELTTKRTGIPKRDGDRSLAPLSFAQQRLWFLEQMEPGNTVYNIPIALRLHGLLNIAVLEQSLQEIVRRHETLRTTFGTVGTESMQIITADVNFSLPLTDLSSAQKEQQAAMTEKLVKAEARQPFDLSTGPLLRCHLLRRSAEEHILLLTMHHIISDGWSVNAVLQEACALYEAFLQGKPSPLPELPIQYADFAVWQRDRLQGGLQKTQMDYWKEQLQGAPIFEIPADHPRPAIQTFTGTQQLFHISPKVAAELQTIGKQEGATLFMTLLTVFNIFLQRYTGQEDIVIGSPITSRNHAELTGLVGLFINTLVFRNDVSGNPSFRQLLRNIIHTCLAAYAHQDIQFEQLVEELQPARDMSRSPIFQVMLVVQNKPMQTVTLPELTMSIIPTESGTAKYDLSLTLTDTEDGLIGNFEYNTDLFEHASIARMISRFEMLLDGIVANPAQRIAELPLLTTQEQHQLLVEWNNTQSEYPQQKSIHQIFEAQAQHTPDAVALVFEQEKLTYAQLNASANQLAHFLQSKGVGPDVLVGVCVERSLEMVIALLAILKAGGAYVPLDPNHPQDRITYMIDDARASMIVTREEWLSILPSNMDATLVLLDRDQEQIALEPPTNLQIEADNDRLAYIVYTSGSTGKPKGTLVTAKGFLNLCHWYQAHCPITETSRVLLALSFNFDACYKNIFAPLMAGGRLVLAPTGYYDPVKLVSLITDQAITIINATPSMIQPLIELAQQGDYHSLSSLEYLGLGGEALQLAPLRHWLESPQCHCALHNIYGPTECTDISTSYRVLPSNFNQLENVPIGMPINNMHAYVLDRALSPVPVGVVGELYLSGAGLARGYLKRADLTAGKFIPNPFSTSTSPGERMYRSGDLARRLPAGNIEYLGRIDHQVKIRGLRIELGEIESTLATLPEVREAVTIAHGDRPDQKRLVAYLVLKDGQSLPETAALRSKLAQSLPEYMIPSHFIVLEKLPLNPNGKLDRKALPAPDLQQGFSKEYVAPRSLVEETLAKIWANILGLEQVGIHDNFFEIGGNSLLSMHVVTQVRQAGFDLSTRHIFQHQTIAELAPVVDTAPAPRTEETTIATKLGPVAPNQHWYFDQNFPDPNRFNISMMFEVPMQMRLDLALAKEVVRILLLHHEALRMRFVQDGSRWRQFITSPDAEEIPFTVIDLSDLPSDQEQSEAIEANCHAIQKTLHMTEGPLLRVIIFDLGVDKPGRLLMIVHHLVADSFSSTILVQDFLTAYQQLAAGSPIQLPPKTTAYHKWSERLVEYTQSAEMQQEQDLWQAQPNDPPLGAPSPDYPDGEYIFADGTCQIDGELDKTTTKMLLEETQKYEMQPIEVALAAMAEALGPMQGEPSVYVDILRHGRDIPLDGMDLSRTVGWFVIHYPLLLQLGKGNSLPEKLRRTREQYRRPIHGGVGYDLIRYMSEDENVVKTMRPRPVIAFSFESFLPTSTETSMSMRPAKESSGYTCDGYISWPYLLELRTWIEAEQLHWAWKTGVGVYYTPTMEQLSERFKNILKKIAAG